MGGRLPLPGRSARGRIVSPEAGPPRGSDRRR
jgi:hypothetical protein